MHSLYRDEIVHSNSLRQTQWIKKMEKDSFNQFYPSLTVTALQMNYRSTLYEVSNRSNYQSRRIPEHQCQ